LLAAASLQGGGIGSWQAGVGVRWGPVCKVARWPLAARIVLGMGARSRSVAAQPRQGCLIPTASGEGSEPVAWGAIKEEARQRAGEACKN